MPTPDLCANKTAIQNKVQPADKESLQDKVALCAVKLQQERRKRRQLGQLLYQNVSIRIPKAVLALTLALPCYFLLRSWVQKKQTSGPPVNTDQSGQPSQPSQPSPQITMRTLLQSFLALGFYVRLIWQSATSLLQPRRRCAAPQFTRNNRKKSA